MGSPEWQIKFQPTSVRLLCVCVSCVQTRKAGSERCGLRASVTQPSRGRGAMRDRLWEGACVRLGRPLEGRDRLGVCLGSSSSRTLQSSRAVVRVGGTCWGSERAQAPLGAPFARNDGAPRGASANGGASPHTPGALEARAGETGPGTRAGSLRRCPSPVPSAAAAGPVGGGSRLARGGAGQRMGRRRPPRCAGVGTGPRPCAPGQTRTGAASSRGADRGHEDQASGSPVRARAPFPHFFTWAPGPARVPTGGIGVVGAHTQCSVTPTGRR